ncbi:MAG: hypothetical protein JXA18_08030 [Chitinispirillaceae bacterium]|nr:hypothetical protein [Chitinispirillaceae bacterium]
MKKMHIACLALLLGSVVASSEEWLNGKVTDAFGDPIVGALLWFSTNEATAVTDSSGEYRFDSASINPVRLTRQRWEATGPSLSRNSISFTVAGQPAAIRLEIMDLAGRCVDGVLNERLSPGSYSFALPAGGLPVAMYVISLQINDRRFTWRALGRENGTLQSGVQSPAAASPNHRRTAEEEPEDESLDDTLHCTCEKYFRRDTAITSYEGTIDFEMSSILPKGPYVKVLGGDTVQHAFQESEIWLKYWTPDSFFVYLEYDTSLSYLSPPTNTNEDMYYNPSFTLLPYRIGMYDGTADTTAHRLIVLFDSSKTDEDAPVITLDPETVELTKGTFFDLKEGLTITEEGDTNIDFTQWVNITDDIRTTEERQIYRINFNVPGTYTVTYRVMDTHMNMAEKQRTIVVTK